MSKHLHELIRSLDRNEKRLFKRLAGQNKRLGKHDSLLLYEILEQMPEYDASVLDREVASGALPSDIAAGRYKLYNLLLKSLRDYHLRKNPNSRNEEHLGNISVLFGKELYSQCLKQISILKGKAEASQDLATLIQLVDWESRIQTSLPHSDIVDAIRVLQSRKEDLLKAYQAEQSWLSHFRTAFMISKTRYTNLSEELRESIARIRDEESPGSNAQEPTHLAQTCKHLALGLLDFMEQKFEAAYGHLKLAKQSMDENPVISGLYPDIQRLILTNLINTALSLGRIKELLDYLEVARNARTTTPTDTRRLRQNVYYADLVYCLNYGEEVRGIRLVGEIMRWVDERIDQIDPGALFNFYYNSAIFHFLYGHLKDALLHLNRILDSPRTDIRKDIYEFAHIFQLAVHYEYGNYDLLEYQIRNVKRFLKTSGNKRPYEKRILKFFHEVIRAVDEDDRRAKIAQANAFIEGILRSGKGEKPLGCQEFNIWLSSMLAGRKVGDFLQEMISRR